MPAQLQAPNLDFKNKLLAVFVANELGSNSPYSMQYADPKGSVSGWSFGWNQMDLARNSATAVPVLRNILQNAVDANSNRIVPAADVEPLIRLATQRNPRSLDATATSTPRATINSALASAFGQQVLDTRINAEMNDIIQVVDDVIARATTPDDQAFLAQELPKLFLCDYHNQYTIDNPALLSDILGTRPDPLVLRIDADELVRGHRASLPNMDVWVDPRARDDRSIDRSLGQLVTAMASFDSTDSVEELTSWNRPREARAHELFGCSSRYSIR